MGHPSALHRLEYPHRCSEGLDAVFKLFLKLTLDLKWRTFFFSDGLLFTTYTVVKRSLLYKWSEITRRRHSVVYENLAMPTCKRPKLSIVFFCVAGTEKVSGALNIAGNIIGY